MKRKAAPRIKIEQLNEEAVKAIEEVKNYLEIEKGMKADYSDIVVAGLKMALRTGPGMYGIWWELQEEAVEE
jgi:hypothetical protein